jgi:hypothetical protein
METIIILIIGVILFIYWQFTVLKKYALKFDSFKIDKTKRCIIVRKEIIKFRDIDYIAVEELEQPSVVEKTLTKSGAYCYMSKLIICMKDGTVKECTFNYKGILYKTLKELKPFVNIDADIEKYKPNAVLGYIIIIILSTCILISLLSAVRSL